MKTLNYIFLLSLISLFCLFACINEEVPLQQHQLSINVSAKRTDTRGIIKESFLPDQSSIGVTLLNENGELYDGISYHNIQYNVNGTTSQTWVAEDDILLSLTRGKAVAYYPYRSDVTDLTAIPIETSSQTDYMYSEWVTGISNTNPHAAFIMNHACSVIRVNVKKGNYTGTGQVTEIAVCSEGFGNVGLLNAVDGSISEISGHGEEICVSTSFHLSDEGTETDVLVVPDLSNTEQPLTILVTIDGNRYVAIEQNTSVFSQGDIYTYTVSIN